MLLGVHLAHEVGRCQYIYMSMCVCVHWLFVSRGFSFVLWENREALGGGS
jgi:hypothetical protein